MAEGSTGGPVVVVTDDRFGDDYPEERAVLSPLGIELRVARCGTPEEVSRACRDADGVLVNLAPVDAEALRGFAKCRGIVRYGVGMDNVDLAAAAGLGIPVRNVPGYCDDEVAEHALALLMDCARSVSMRDRSVREGRWNLRPPVRRVSGSVLGVLGFGGIARAFLRRAIGLGFREIAVWSPTLSQERLEGGAGEAVLSAARSLGSRLRSVGFRECLRSADYLSVHVPHSPGAAPLLGAAELSLLPKGAVLVNTSRGALVDESALARALRSGDLGAAGLDVFQQEPLPADSPLRGLPNTVLTDHAAWYSEDSVRVLRTSAARTLAGLLNLRNVHAGTAGEGPSGS